MRAFVHGLLDLIYPCLCILCKKPLFPGEKKGQLCVRCQGQIILNRPPFCMSCSRPLADASAFCCKECRLFPVTFHRAWGVCLYDETMRRLIHLFKYGNKTGLRHHFVHLILDFLAAYRIDLSPIDLLVPVPLHATRLRERGYNQAQLLVVLLAQQLALPHSAKNLCRIRNTKSQAKLSQKERWTNIQQAFTINNSKEFQDKNVLLVDDLLTTGATTSEAARTLKQAGARRVDVLALAITH